MAVRAHRHEVTAFFFHPLDNLICRLAIGQLGVGGYIGSQKLRPDLFQVRFVFGDFGADGVGSLPARGRFEALARYSDRLATTGCTPRATCIGVETDSILGWRFRRGGWIEDVHDALEDGDDAA